jgi:hypothetical protein
MVPKYGHLTQDDLTIFLELKDLPALGLLKSGNYATPLGGLFEC